MQPLEKHEAIEGQMNQERRQDVMIYYGVFCTTVAVYSYKYSG